ncbi:MAG TPA: oligopeptide/dipeptide ABC transporter ATP-binding protein [Thermoanaerobaculia bacterium]|jgi:oligopeptide/dipeptide ABC transporter ATP-binding protein|nr:oligopeptide/dipeptide ABC transporter ATP-binding protein [Thermoanaerobaculia bacterium]
MNGPGGAVPAPAATAPEVLLAAEGLEKRYPLRRSPFGRRPGSLAALAGVDLEVRRGECLAVVGESGSGKTTLARCLLRLIEPTAGQVRFAGEDLLALPAGELRRRRRRFQMIYQDPYDSLDPRQRIGAALAEPLLLHHLEHVEHGPGAAAPPVPAVPPASAGAPGTAAAPGGRRRRRRAARRRALDLLATVGLPASTADSFPHELSGGQRQRVGIARALAVEPELLVADEPVSALDVSVRSQILNLLAELQQRMGLTVVLIAHDLAAVEQLADRVAVFYLGRIVELAPRAELFARPLHPYTVGLLASVPVAWPLGSAPGGERRVRAPLAGEPPSPAAPPPGCPFHPRCPVARARCAVERPELLPAAAGPGVTPAAGAAGSERLVACFFPGSLPPGGLPRLEAPPAP